MVDIYVCGSKTGITLLVVTKSDVAYIMITKFNVQCSTFNTDRATGR